jgi:hypothetical protein
MKNISGQYQDLLEGKMNKAQFLRNARMMFPNFVTNHNSFDDSVAILKQKGMLNEGDAVKGTPDKEPTYDSLTPDDKIKYKKVEQSPEVDEQDGIYPATTITDIPKTKTYKKVKNTSDGLEPIKDNDTKNELKKVKVVKESVEKDIEKAIRDKKIDPAKVKAAAEKAMRGDSTELAVLMAFGGKVNPMGENMEPEEIDNAEVEISQNRSSIQAMADKMGISQEELFKLLLKKLGGMNETQIDEAKTAPDAQAVIGLIEKNTMLLNKLKMINNKEELQPVFDFLLTKINQTIAKNTQQVKTATTTSAQNYSKMGSVTEKTTKLESLVNKVMNETLSKKSAR